MSDPMTPPPNPARAEQLRIQQLGSGISRRDWYWTEKAYEAIRDEFDRRPAAPSPAGGDASQNLATAVKDYLRHTYHSDLDDALETFRALSPSTSAASGNDQADRWHKIGKQLAETNEWLFAEIDRLKAEMRLAKSTSAAEPVGEIVMFGGVGKEVSWRGGRMPPEGTKLYATPPAPAAVERAQGVKGAFRRGFRAGEAYHNSKWHHYKAPNLDEAWDNLRASLATEKEG